MKIYENNIEIKTGKILYTNDIFKILNEIDKKNKNYLLITPLTKVKEIISFNKDSGLDRMIHQILEDNFIVNNGLATEIIRKINALINDDFLVQLEDNVKINKNVFDLSDIQVSNQNLPFILKLIEKYFDKIPEIIIIGFNLSNISNNLSFLQITSNLSNHIKYENLEKLVIDFGNEIFEIHEKNNLLGWLEKATGNVITFDDIIEYFSGMTSYLSFLIDRAFKSLSSTFKNNI